MPGGSVVTTLTQKRTVFPAFQSREVTSGKMCKVIWGYMRSCEVIWGYRRLCQLDLGNLF